MGAYTARDSGSGGAVVAGVMRQYRLGTFTCAVGSDDPDLTDLLDRCLSPFRIEAERGIEVRRYMLATDASRTVALIVDDEKILVRGSRAAVGDHLLWEVSQQGIASVTDRLALHAGAVSWGKHGIVLPGQSGAGKSTLVSGLTVAGCEYLSDEVGLIDLGSGSLDPYPRALWVAQKSIELIPGLSERLPPNLDGHDRPERHVPPDALRADPIGGSCPLRFVVAPQYVPGEDTVLEPIRRSEAVIALMGNAFNFDNFKEAGLVALAKIADQITAYRLRMGDLSSAVDLIMQAVTQTTD